MPGQQGAEPQHVIAQSGNRLRGRPLEEVFNLAGGFSGFRIAEHPQVARELMCRRLRFCPLVLGEVTCCRNTDCLFQLVQTLPGCGKVTPPKIL